MLHVEAVDDVHARAYYNDVLICVWQKPPTLAALNQVHELARKLVARAHHGIGVFGIAQAGMSMIGAAERRRAGDLLREFGENIRAIASVIEGTGFRAGTTRSVMTAITLFARQPARVKIFATVDEAVVWQAPLIDMRPSDLSDAVTATRQRLR
jgi:hypothetical protein